MQDKTHIAVDVFDRRASEYAEKFMDTSLYHDTFDFFCRSIPKKDAGILEAACGPGNITKYLLQQRPDFRVLGTDLAPHMLELARTYNPEAEFRLLDARDIKSLGKRFEGIMCGFCLPYLSQEEAVQFIRDAADILQPDGVLYLSTMEADYSQSGWQTGSAGDRLYLHYHQEDYLTEALLQSRFRILNLQRKTAPAQDSGTTTDLVILAGKL